ncbi:hypothetical protein TREAZ_2606 [Leadbettera azotonutricia ZAS-9]|uniref:Uncharacterized protein n=1 Tax=Leadbettera azotonutricia (strain ATCC BAA-888 / DSM 13862 / ZAS-9) TaxID=545695 RepID=F5YEG3_LEAAZ|nr:hypothetical protein TREAZ_2606 [Leadbettera azotonutricia ZAS-9]
MQMPDSVFVENFSPDFYEIFKLREIVYTRDSFLDIFLLF